MIPQEFQVTLDFNGRGLNSRPFPYRGRLTSTNGRFPQVGRDPSSSITFSDEVGVASCRGMSIFRHIIFHVELLVHLLVLLLLGSAEPKKRYLFLFMLFIENTLYFEDVILINQFHVGSSCSPGSHKASFVHIVVVCRRLPYMLPPLTWVLRYYVHDR